MTKSSKEDRIKEMQKKSDFYFLKESGIAQLKILRYGKKWNEDH